MKYISGRILVSVILFISLIGCSSQEGTNMPGLGWAKFTASISEKENIPSEGNVRLNLSTTDSLYSNTWDNIESYPDRESLYIGQYIATAWTGTRGEEGYNCPCYIGTSKFQIEENKGIDVTIDCTLSQAMIYANISDNLKSAFQDIEVIVHTEGCGYNNVIPSSESPLLITPGTTKLYISLKNDAGASTTVTPTDFILKTEAEETYIINLEYENNTLKVISGDIDSEIAIDDEIFNMMQPAIDSVGFESGMEIRLVEGYPSSTQISMIARADAGIKSLPMTVQGNVSFEDSDITFECDLLNPPASLINQGLQVNRISDKEIVINFSGLLENMSVMVNSNIDIKVRAIDNLGRVSCISELKVSIISIDFGVISQTDAVVGLNQASVTLSMTQPEVEAKDFAIYLTDETQNAVSQLPISSSEVDIDQRQITLNFEVPSGVANVPILIDFMDVPKSYVVIKRTVPEYEISVDAYATQTLIQVICEQEKVRDAIVHYGIVTVNGKEVGVSLRDKEHAFIRAYGLEPSTTYNISLVVVKDRFSPEAKITTESASQIPDGDFEDTDVSIAYEKLPMGGAYSNTLFPVYNMQNYQNLNVYWPQKNWMSVNAKTFCLKATNYNTWYMQPSSEIDFKSSVTGNKSIKLTSVGWSLDGADIQPYAQKEGSYVPYNSNVPFVSHRAAGKLFLGTYEFDPISVSETYVEGISFNSRPSSLNGFYKYIPVNANIDDYGLVNIELINDEMGTPLVIASASMNFAAAPDFIAFNLPLNYEMIGIKATKLKLMFSSSHFCGTIAQEDMNVPTIIDLQNSVYRGSELWIDNISFSY